MLIDIHTHNSKTAEGTFAIRSFSISDIQAGNSPLDCLYYSIGLHPWHTTSPNWIELLQQFAAKPNCLMIGECGIDHLKGDEIINQTAHFETHIRLSEEYRKPLIIHSVRAHSEILGLRINSRASQPWIIHGFHGSLQMADALICHGIHLSFGNHLSDLKTQEIIRHLGPNNILLETDDSPVSIADIYQQAAAILGITTTMLKTSITLTANRLGII